MLAARARYATAAAVQPCERERRKDKAHSRHMLQLVTGGGRRSDNSGPRYECDSRRVEVDATCAFQPSCVSNCGDWRRYAVRTPWLRSCRRLDGWMDGWMEAGGWMAAHAAGTAQFAYCVVLCAPQLAVRPAPPVRSVVSRLPYCHYRLSAVELRQAHTPTQTLTAQHAIAATNTTARGLLCNQTQRALDLRTTACEVKQRPALRH